MYRYLVALASGLAFSAAYEAYCHQAFYTTLIWHISGCIGVAVAGYMVANSNSTKHSADSEKEQ